MGLRASAGAKLSVDLWTLRASPAFAVAMLIAPVIGVTPAYLNMVFGAPNPTEAYVVLTFASRS